MSTYEAKDMMLRDALETAIKAERELIKLRRRMRICAAIGCAVAIIGVILSRNGD